MAEQKSGPLETGAPMDYSEHEKTFNLFVAGTKYGTIFCIALLIAMACYFFTGAGALVSIPLFILLNIGGAFILR